MTVVTRFAPSPTGLLHVGNARAALVNWLLAAAAKAQHGDVAGRFILRIDDTDPDRCDERFVGAIDADLAWLGCHSDRRERQSTRLARYAAAADRLRAADRLYPCYEAPEELALKRKSRLQRGLPPIYDRAALALTDADRQRLEAAGRRPHWRFRLDPGDIAWDDMVRGAVRFDAANLGDPVLLRADGQPLYHLPSVVDDIDFGITHVVRGEDHVDNTALHIQLFQALGGAVPRFGHLSMLADAEGKGLSKRLGSLGLQALRADGLEALTVAAYLARLGTARPVAPVTSLAGLVADFDIAAFGRATPRFDPADLAALNARILHGLPHAAVAGRLAGIGLADLDAGFWDAVRPNLQRLHDAATWWEICRGTVGAGQPDARPAGSPDDADFLAAARGLLPAEPWDDTVWQQWTDAVKQATGRKGKALFMPLRRALTGQERGPELAVLLPLIGRDRALSRLGG